ncbi:LOW QUALITY PROTEIN: hypothetical protein V2J09_014563 [Rumex salicifolius]
MAEVAKLLYLVVVEDEEKREKDVKESFRYTRPVLQSTLQLMGCKPRHALKISKRVFEVIRSRNTENPASEMEVLNSEPLDCEVQDERYKSVPFELYKRRTTVVIRREMFFDVVCDALDEYKYMGPNQKADLALACRIRERKESVTVLLCGTSGCGKSTLSSLLGSRMGITTVISTDSIRHMMRSFVDEKQNPLLWSSTYHAGEHLDPIAVAEAKAKRKAKKLDGISPSVSKDPLTDGTSGSAKPDAQSSDVGPKQMAIEGFKAQSEMVIDSLDRLITAWEDRKESVIVEGVHLSLNFVMGLMKKHPSIIPFMIYISNEDKHLERFAVRAKYMTLDPAKNKYVKYIRNIRTIQDYLCGQADKHVIPKVNNTNVDRSVAAIHATLFSCLRKRGSGEQLYDPATNTVTTVYEEYKIQCAANSVTSKGMFQLIQRKGSSRNLMAFFNTDGSVAKAWPVESDNRKPDNGIGTSMYGPFQIGKAEPINLQFGHFGISAWRLDIGGTSHSSSYDESKTDSTCTDYGSNKCHSSSCSSPRISDGLSKEVKLKEEDTVFGSDEEGDEFQLESDDDFSDEERHTQDEIDGGSVDEESAKSDEEYDDLAMTDFQENSYWCNVNQGLTCQQLFPATDKSVLNTKTLNNKNMHCELRVYSLTKTSLLFKVFLKINNISFPPRQSLILTHPNLLSHLVNKPEIMANQHHTSIPFIQRLCKRINGLYIQMAHQATANVAVCKPTMRKSPYSFAHQTDSSLALLALYPSTRTSQWRLASVALHFQGTLSP